MYLGEKSIIFLKVNLVIEANRISNWSSLDMKSILNPLSFTNVLQTLQYPLLLPTICIKPKKSER